MASIKLALLLLCAGLFAAMIAHANANPRRPLRITPLLIAETDFKTDEDAAVAPDFAGNGPKSIRKFMVAAPPAEFLNSIVRMSPFFYSRNGR